MKEPDYLRKALEKRIENNSFRELRLNKDLIDFCSNDYLGLAIDPLLKRKFDDYCTTFSKSGLGTAGSRLLAGNHSFHIALEKQLAAHHKSEACLLMNSGYNANLAVFSSIPQRGDTILYDELSHACIKDGARLSLADKFSFRHNDLEDLERLLKKAKGSVYIAVESVYSMDGDFAPLAGLCKLCTNYNNTYLIVDEAHSTGLWGSYGAGLVEELGLSKDVFIRIHTFGKAIGTHGACVAGSRAVYDYLVNFARQFIYTTSLPFHSIAATHLAYEHLTSHHTTLWSQLNERIQHFRKEIKSSAIESLSPIQAVLIPGNDKVKAVCKKLNELNFDVRPILSPTVKEGSERLRICLHTYNTFEEIAALAHAINNELE